MDGKDYSQSKLSKPIETIKKLIKTESGKSHPNEAKLKKYKKTQEIFEKTQKKLKNIIDNLKTKEDPTSTSIPKQKYYEVWFGTTDEKSISLSDIEAKASEKGVEMSTLDTSGVSDSSISVSNSSIRPSFIDHGKNVVNDFMHGGRVSKFFAATCVGLGAADIATKGITKLLVKNGAIKSTYSFFGLAKYGFSFVPDLFSKFCSFAGGLMSANPVTTALLGGFVALETIPVLVRAIKKISEKHKLKIDEKKNFEEAIASVSLGG